MNDRNNTDAHDVLDRALEQLDDPAESYRAREALEELEERANSAERWERMFSRETAACEGLEIELDHALDWLNAANERIRRIEQRSAELFTELEAEHAEFVELVEPIVQYAWMFARDEQPDAVDGMSARRRLRRSLKAFEAWVEGRREGEP